MMPLAPTARRWLSALAVTALSVWLVSCEMPADMSQAKPEIAIKPQPVEGDANASGEALPNADTPVGVLIHRVDMPLDVSLDASWAAVDEQAVPMLMHGMWQTNGLRIGILHAEQAQAFAEALPPILGESRAKLFTAHYPTAIRSTPRLIDPVTVDLTAPPRSPTLYRARDGRLQLLARIGRDESGQAWLELTPHHYKPKADLIPRSPLEKALDGKVFDTLSAMLPLSPDTAIVVGLHRPWPEPDKPADTEQTPADQTEQTGDAESTPDKNPKTETDPDSDPDQQSAISDQQSSAPPLPEGLGRSLMAGERAGKPTQMLMVISIIEEPPPANNAADRP
jgi:hypothetical protein